MEEYLNLVENVITKGTHRPNRTAVDTISTFGEYYEIDVSEGFPLLTTKEMSSFRWNSLIHEVLWYFSGEEHIRNLREETSIWDAWADGKGELDTAYGRFWRKYPVPSEASQLPGETWPDSDCKWVTEEDGVLVFDQLQYVIDTLNGDNPNKGPKTRRLVINAWHPANATISTLPPCHYTYVFNVQGDGTLNLHLTQRSGDTALGVPFNIAAYSLLLNIVASQTGYEVGNFAHTIVDSHIYCGKDERGEWYGDNLEKIQEIITESNGKERFENAKEYIEENAPPQEENYDHIPNLLEQLTREPKERPEIEIADKGIDELEYDDFNLKDYECHSGLDFSVAE